MTGNGERGEWDGKESDAGSKKMIGEDEESDWGVRK